MTQTLDVAGRYSQLDSARAAEAPAAETQTRSKAGTFAIHSALPRRCSTRFSNGSIGRFSPIFRE